MDDANSGQWHQLARQTRRKINCGWWLHVCGTPMVVAALGLLGPMLWARRVWPAQAQRWGAELAGAALAACLLGAWWLARRRFVGLDEAMVRLEERLGMHNRLTAAAAGVCPWPPLPARPDDGIRWSLANTLLPPLAAAAFLAAALWLPVQPRPLPTAPDEPAAWAATEADLRELARQDAAARESLDETLKQVAELRAQDADKWFSHASLEATDQMREAHVRSMADLQRQLTRAQESASRLGAEDAATLPAQTRAGLQDQFNQAVRGMRACDMKPNKELMEKLRAIDPKQLRELDEEQMAQLMEEMKKKCEALSKCLGCKPGEAAHEDEGAALVDGDDGAGNGGVNRGPGTSPDVFGKTPGDVAAQQPQFLESGDLSRSLPGDVLETTNSKHEVEMTRPPLRAGGTADVRSGGASTWQEALHPSEQEAVKKFFE